MIDHQPTDQELQAMQDARQRLTEANAALGNDLEPGSQALSDLAVAAQAFTRAVRTVLYGSPDEPQQPRTTSAYEASNDLARQFWPTRPPGTPGG